MAVGPPYTVIAAHITGANVIYLPSGTRGALVLAQRVCKDRSVHYWPQESLSVTVNGLNNPGGPVWNSVRSDAEIAPFRRSRTGKRSSRFKQVASDRGFGHGSTAQQPPESPG